jgi:uncharacterized protein YraI
MAQAYPLPKSGGNIVANRAAVKTLPGGLKLAFFIGALIFLAVSGSSCSVSQEAVDRAVAETLTAQAAVQTAQVESQSFIGTAVAAAVATEVQAIMKTMEAERASLPPPSVATVPAVTEAPTATEEVVETSVPAEEDPDVALRLTTLALLGDTGVGTGGAEEEAACLGGLFASCATNKTDSNVNVRTGPGVEYDFITVITPQDDEDTVPVKCRVQNGWLNVILSISLKRDGWVSEEFMRVDGTPPICETIPPTPKVFPTVTPTPTPTPTHTPTVTPTPTDTPKPDISVFVFNASSFDVCRLEVYPSSDTSGNNRLGSSDVLEPQETKAIQLPASADGKNYQFKAWDCASDHNSDPPLEEARLEVDKGMTWTITDP